MIQPFAMPAEDFPPASIPPAFTGLFPKAGTVLERLSNLWSFNNKNGNQKL
jgi:inositol hexakisphosphate/diphosphoinositol-pentakisphosphate kinase